MLVLVDVCVLSRDLMFFTAVEGVAGALGHRPRHAESLGDIQSPDLLIVDFGSASFDVAALAAAFDPLRTAIFTPHVRTDVFTAARAHGIAHVYRRGALATELPRLMAEYAA